MRISTHAGVIDIYTLERSFEKLNGIDGKTILFAGDLNAVGRSARWRGYLRSIATFNWFAAPDALQIGADILAMLKEGMSRIACVTAYKMR